MLKHYYRQLMEMKMNMNRFLAAMAIAALVGTSPALAQSWDPDVGSGNTAPAPYGETSDGASVYQHDGAGFNAHAEAPRHSAKSGRTRLERSDVVTDEAGNVEQDPDLNIRSQIIRENNEF
jgi:hypothetical protein